MDFLASLFDFFTADMPEPTNFGWFHILSLVLIAGFAFFLCKRFSNCREETFRKIVLISWIVIIILEIYKQVTFGLSFENGEFKWDYAWYSFPYQFCSTPIYALPFIAFLPDGKVRDAFIAFMTFFSFFAGLAVMCYPNDVFIPQIGINVQTMVHHGLQVALGIFFCAYKKEKITVKYFLKGGAVFSAFLLVAIILNVSVYHAFGALGIDETFNMFFISPYFDCTLPILSSIQSAAPYVVFLLVYIIGFTAAAFIMYLAQYGILKLLKRGKHAED